MTPYRSQGSNGPCRLHAKRTLGVFPCHKLCYQVINTGKQHRKTTEHINSRVKTRDIGKQGTTAKISTHLNITPDYV